MTFLDVLMLFLPSYYAPCDEGLTLYSPQSLLRDVENNVIRTCHQSSQDLALCLVNYLPEMSTFRAIPTKIFLRKKG